MNKLGSINTTIPVEAWPRYKDRYTVEAIFATTHYPSDGARVRVKIEEVRTCWDADPSKPFKVADVRISGALLGFGVRVEDLSEICLFISSKEGQQ